MSYPRYMHVNWKNINYLILFRTDYTLAEVALKGKPSDTKCEKLRGYTYKIALVRAYTNTTLDITHNCTNLKRETVSYSLRTSKEITQKSFYFNLNF